MKMIRNLIICLLVILFVGPIIGQQQQKQQQQPSAEEQKMMERWKEYATPGEHHKYLEYFAGNWDVTATVWMKPGAAPEVSKGEGTSEMILGGRYLKSHFKGSMMGQPFEGISFTGYDNFKKEFISVWMDTGGTGIYQTTGTLDKATKTRTETGTFDDFMTGNKMKVRWVTKIIDDNNFKFEMYDEREGKEFKSGEIAYTRKSK
ncbi:MAG: DUF1579 domain-containing protein [Candidatus Omnitrophota bacterium]